MPVVIAQPKALSLQVTPKDAILFEQIGKGILLLTIQPADQYGEEHPQREHIDHGARVSITDRDSISRDRWPS